MKRFRSKWRSVLGLAEFEHRKALLDVGRVSSQLRALREQRETLHGVLEREMESGEERGFEAFQRAYRASLASSIHLKNLEIQRGSAELGELRAKLARVRQRRDSMQELQNKERERWRVEATREEQLELEELARMRGKRSER